MTTKNEINTKAMLVSLRVTTWSARKYDRKISEQVNREHGASKDAGRYNKRLLPGDADSYKELINAAGEARRRHYEQTLPWSDDAWCRLLPSANFMSYTETFRKVKARFDKARGLFVADYPTLRQAARTTLNGMYRNEDYPDPRIIGEKFSMSVSYAPVPASGDFRLDLSRDQMEEIRKSAEERVKSATDEAMQDIFERLYDMLARLHKSLAEPKGVIRDCMMANAEDLMDMLGRMNVTDDPRLDDLRDRIRKQVTAVEPDDLRADKKLRKKTAAEADAILESMKGIYGGAK